MVAIAQRVLSDLDLDRVLQRVLDAASDLTGARYAAIGVLDESRSQLARFVTRGLTDGEERVIGPPPRGRGVLGELITHPFPLRVNDVSAHPHSYGFPAGHPPMTSFLGAPLLVAGEPYGNLYLCDKEGGAPFGEEDEERLVLLAGLAGIAIDHARRYTGADSQRAELAQTVAALDATMQISRALGGETDLEKILQLVAKRGRALVSARTLIIEHLRNGTLTVAAAAGEQPDGLVGKAIDLRNSVASAAMRTGQTQRLEDEPNRMRYERFGLGRLGLSADAGLVVPLIYRGQGFGVLVAVDRLENGPAFTATDVRLLESFATSAATAIATAESVADDRRRQALAAAEQERKRWARELHDETLQGLAALRLGLSAALRAGDPDDTVAGALRETIAQLGTEIGGLRALLTELRPAALDQLGLAAALDALADRARHDGLDVDVDVAPTLGGEDAQQRLDPDLEIAVYRIAQEALTNARKHGEATRALLEVGEQDGHLRICARDDGRGFDPQARTAGFGLMGMRERVELFGGGLAIDSAPGEGTTVTAELPALRRPPARAGGDDGVVINF